MDSSYVAAVESSDVLPNSSSQEAAASAAVEQPHAEIGESLKRLCFTTQCLVFQIFFNAFMSLINGVMIVLDVLVMRQQRREGENGRQPLLPPQQQQEQRSTGHEEYEDVLFFGDVFILAVLIVEFALRLRMSRYNLRSFIGSTEHKFDSIVLLISVVAVVTYAFETKTTVGSDAETVMLGLRVVRDLLRLLRVVYFLKELRNTVVDFQRHQSIRADADDEASASPSARRFSPSLPPHRISDTDINKHWDHYSTRRPQSLSRGVSPTAAGVDVTYVNNGISQPFLGGGGSREESPFVDRWPPHMSGGRVVVRGGEGGRTSQQHQPYGYVVGHQDIDTERER
ncbi:unnamed protein product [Vitrella brassicaformis CCMP3155]|uniref:Ion transport domain-containing protein n=1 Tax=Vitrella brassicaformis (strain CCMP3155) TaxID=1169540 RepID=A0A0G4EYL5_VITBC|nr:unnamed protein product [Vitrella brassicaformis CCMP3155]|eukprot:CEM03826.1 unnamed protein product [Vitrella brassicaformis CCMP3155]